MDRKIVKLSRNPFCVDAGGGYFIEPGSGDVKWGSALMRASKGLLFSLTPETGGQRMRLQYAGIVIDIGWTDEIEDAASWVEDVNGFLKTKRGAADTDGKAMLTTPAGSMVG